MEANGDHNGIHIVKAVEFNNSTIQGTSDGTDVIARPLEAIEVELQKVVGVSEGVDSKTFGAGVSVVASAIKISFAIECGAVGEEQGAARLVACIELIARAAVVGD